MRVVADSHAIFWYLGGSAWLSAPAAEALAEAEATDGIVVSVATLIDLWYVTQTTEGVSADDLATLRARLRHDPPFWSAPWVLDTLARTQRVGTPLDCALCDRLELPTDLRVLRVTDTWDEVTTPLGLRRAHRVADGRWGRIRVETGELRFRAETSPPVNVVLEAGASQAIPPGVEHDVEPLGAVRFRVEFLGPAESTAA